MLKRRLALTGALAALLAGGAVAAVAATSRDHHAGAHGAGHRGGAAIQAASSYLGVSVAAIQTELRAGRTLAQIAAAHGKSEAGLVDAIVAARRARLAAVSATLPQRVAAQVNRVHDGSGAGAVAGRQGVAAAVRGYLGLTSAELRAERLAGKTLAQIADSTPGKSEAGLVAAIRGAREARLTAAVSAGKLTKSEAQARTAALTRRITRLINRQPHAHSQH